MDAGFRKQTSLTLFLNLYNKGEFIQIRFFVYLETNRLNNCTHLYVYV